MCNRQGEYVLPVNQYVAKISSRIKSRQTSQIKKALESSETEIITDSLPFTLCLLSEEANRNLTGLIANRLVEKYNKPAIVLKKNRKMLSGSGRTTSTFKNFKDFCISLGIFERCAGHEGAFGVYLEADKIEKLLEIMKTINLGEDHNTYQVDKAYLGKVSAYEILAVSELNDYFSKGFEKPIFYIEVDVNSDDVKIVGEKKNTIRIKADDITYIKFRCDEEEIKKVQETEVNKIKLIGTFQTNEWNDRCYPQVEILDLEIQGESKKIGFTPKNLFGFNTMNW